MKSLATIIRVNIGAKFFGVYGVAIVFLFIDLPQAWSWIEPLPLLATIFYHTLFIARSLNLFIVWLIGLALDLIMGAYLGENGMALVLSVFPLMVFRKNILTLGNLKIVSIIFGTFLCYQLIIFMMRLYAGEPFMGWIVLKVALLGVLIWLSIVAILFSGKKVEYFT